MKITRQLICLIGLFLSPLHSQSSELPEPFGIPLLGIWKDSLAVQPKNAIEVVRTEEKNLVTYKYFSTEQNTHFKFFTIETNLANYIYSITGESFHFDGKSQCYEKMDKVIPLLKSKYKGTFKEYPIHDNGGTDQRVISIDVMKFEIGLTCLAVGIWDEPGLFTTDEDYDYQLKILYTVKSTQPENNKYDGL